MADIVAWGRPDSAERRRRPPPWLLLVVAAAVLVGFGVWRSWTPAKTADEPRAASSTAPRSPAIPATPSGSPARFSLDAQTDVGPPGLRLEVGGSAPVVVDAQAGRPMPLPRLRRLASGESVELGRLPGATVALVRDQSYAVVDLFVLPDDGGSITSLGQFDGVIRAMDSSLLVYDSGANRPPGRLVSLTAGGRLRWERAFAVPTAVQADTAHGLLIHEMPDPPSTDGPLQLVDPRTGGLRRQLGRAQDVVASTNDAVAWVQAGCDDCQLTVTSLASARNARYTMPDGRLPAYAAFSPDQRLLALSFSGLHDFTPGLDRDGFVAVLDLQSGHLQTVPGLTTEAKSAATLAWSPDGDWLALGVRSPVQSYHDRLVLWRPGQNRLTVLPPRLPPESTRSGLVVLS